CVLTETVMERCESSGRRDIRPQIENPVAPRFDLELGRIIGRFHQIRLGLGDELAVLLRCAFSSLPFRIGSERLPRGLASGAARELEQINQPVISLFERLPVADALDAVLLEQPTSMVTKPRMERRHLAWGRP